MRLPLPKAVRDTFGEGRKAVVDTQAAATAHTQAMAAVELAAVLVGAAALLAGLYLAGKVVREWMP